MKDYFLRLDEWFRNKENETITICQVCDGQKLQVTPFEKRLFSLARCTNCGFVWQFRQPTQEVLNEFYLNSEPMEMWAKIKDTPCEFQRQKEKYSYPWDYIKENNIKSVLDIGCGSGFFLNYVDNSVFKCGIESNTSAVPYCHFPVYSSLEKFRGSIHGARKYDLITLFGVLEHLKNPVEELEKYIDYLSDGGSLAIIVPNIDSLVVKTLGEECSTFCPQHLWYYSGKTLPYLLGKLGLENIGWTTIESEVQPILRKLKGFSAYEDIGIQLTDKDISERTILGAGRGYKISAIFKKGE